MFGTTRVRFILLQRGDGVGDVDEGVLCPIQFTEGPPPAPRVPARYLSLVGFLETR